MGLLHLAELGGILGGVLLLLVFAGARLHGEASRRMLLASFDDARSGSTAAAGGAVVDQSLWSPARIAKYRDSLKRSVPAPLAVLRIPRIGLEVPVLPGIDDQTLDRAVGLVPGTAAPGASGNVAIAGHRDGFFRGLKDLAVGDRLVLETVSGRQEYAVDKLAIVDPSDVGVLDDSAQPVLTLITCYPFYFVGKAPQRFVVRASARPPAAGAEVR